MDFRSVDILAARWSGFEYGKAKAMLVAPNRNVQTPRMNLTQAVSINRYGAFEFKCDVVTDCISLEFAEFMKRYEAALPIKDGASLVSCIQSNDFKVHVYMAKTVFFDHTGNLASQENLMSAQSVSMIFDIVGAWTRGGKYGISLEIKQMKLYDNPVQQESMFLDD
jgi:hypothetical protein